MALNRTSGATNSRPVARVYTFFEIARVKNNCYTAELLYQAYKDSRNKVYLIYLKSILGQVQSALKAFEAENSENKTDRNFNQFSGVTL